MEMPRIKFGDLKVGPLARRKIAQALDRNWVTEGPNVREFEERYAAKFGWKHCIATSSGTTAGEVAWAAVRELLGKTPHSCQGDIAANRGFIATPACAFVATASCITAAGLEPLFVDISLETLNMDVNRLGEVLKRAESINYSCAAIQFVMNMGRSVDLDRIGRIGEERSLPVIVDACEGHGGTLHGVHINRYGSIKAAIYSFYVAHLIQAGEGGCICTDDDEIAELCRSIKSHGRPAGSNYFDFQKVGFNAKWNDLAAAIGLESLERFDETFAKRREVRAKLIQALEPFEDRLILYRDAPGEVIAPHALPVVLRDEREDVRPLRGFLEYFNIEVKTLFGSLPTQHKAFEWLGHRSGDFPVAERIGRTGLHFGCHEGMTDGDIDYIYGAFKEYFQKA